MATIKVKPRKLMEAGAVEDAISDFEQLPEEEQLRRINGSQEVNKADDRDSVIRSLKRRCVSLARDIKIAHEKLELQSDFRNAREQAHKQAYLSYKETIEKEVDKRVCALLPEKTSKNRDVAKDDYIKSLEKQRIQNANEITGLKGTKERLEAELRSAPCLYEESKPKKRIEIRGFLIRRVDGATFSDEAMLEAVKSLIK